MYFNIILLYNLNNVLFIDDIFVVKLNLNFSFDFIFFENMLDYDDDHCQCLIDNKLKYIFDEFFSIENNTIIAKKNDDNAFS